MTFFLGIVSIGLIITGTNDRSYSVSSPGSKIRLNASEFNLNELAEKYLPQLAIDTDEQSRKVEKVYYEIIDQGKMLIINYYFVWDTQNNPKFIPNVAWKIWNFIYYRFNLDDIEFVQLNVDKTTGEIVSAKVKNEVSNKSQSSICLSVKSWNHNFDFCSITDKSSKPNISLHYFENSDYSSLKMARRSQGDFETKDSIMNYPFIIFLALLATYYFRHLQKDYNNEYSEN